MAGGGVGHLSRPLVVWELYGLPEELLPDPKGSLMGGGLCFTPFPNVDVWTRAEKLSPSISLLGEGGPCPTLPELWDILTLHFTSLSYTPLY